MAERVECRTSPAALRAMTHSALAGTGLPERWRRCERFTLLATPFGDGSHFIATWQAWRDDPQRCRWLTFIAVEPLARSSTELAAAHAGSPWPELAALLCNAWPPLTRNLHDLHFDNGNVRLLLAFGDLNQVLPELVAEVDAFYLHDPTTAQPQAALNARVAKVLGRLAAPGATLTAQRADAGLRASLLTAGFDVPADTVDADTAPLTLLRFAPRVVPRIAPRVGPQLIPELVPKLVPPSRPSFASRRKPARRSSPTAGSKHALIVGAGLAGCASAWALAEQGWHSTLIDRHAAPASEASGNAAGLFHGIVNPQDGLHARFNRGAALMAHDAVAQALREHGVSGASNGLLRTETERELAQMRSLIADLGLPGDYVQALSADAASAQAGLALGHPAWFYPGGGWVQPPGLARSFIERAGSLTSLRLNSAVQALQRTPAGWELHDAAGGVIDAAAVVVLANAGDALRLLGAPAWPVRRVRGQVSGWPVSAPGRAPHCRMPVAGSGYLLPPVDGTVWFGATSQPGDDDPAVRMADHAVNLAQLRRLSSEAFTDPPDSGLDALLGRTAWRWSANDRLPVIGGVPDTTRFGTDHGALPDQVRLAPCLPGLYAFTALGSRGITWCALGARVLAALVAGAPVPLEARLIDAIAPARFAVRAGRRRRSQRL